MTHARCWEASPSGLKKFLVGCRQVYCKDLALAGIMPQGGKLMEFSLVVIALSGASFMTLVGYFLARGAQDCE